MRTLVDENAGPNALSARQVASALGEVSGGVNVTWSPGSTIDDAPVGSHNQWGLGVPDPPYFVPAVV